MVLVTQLAPDFSAPAILGNGKFVNNFNLKEYIQGTIAVLFFWPMDFTFVCPSEIITFDKNYEKFKQKNVKIIGISIDSIFVHNAWRNTHPKEGGIGKVQYVMVSDTKRKIQKSYGVEHPQLGVALRASFIIDTHQIVRHQIVNDLPFGRNIKEIFRMIDAIQFHELNGEVCPANWNIGKPGMQATPAGVKNYLSKKYFSHEK
ncbi:alkyl hydroperoxide reductase [Buchnera aphidicola (Nipponaphis monzeni)]|uniref:Thioredoxin peroxidase n=1 Tax=Buchnera aphidicola (Nipponaphis monzeni) TaxID=2495405 RepID=A0A455TA17_9GAMM|nr:peroxiredoxin C [Buchnera aphidicola]BBI01163.1 alkyl hydroperoxide reductase [Buchnera aphidicola (Nipponaphis monzeni)]